VMRLGGATVLANERCALTMLNCILLRSVSPDRLEALLEVGRVALAGFRRAPALFLSPLAGDVAALQQRLYDLGWRPALRQAVLCRRLDERLPEAPAGVAVAETADLEGWGRLLVEAYEVPAPWGDEIRAAWTSLSGEARYYLALLDGQAVGTGLTWRQGPIAGLYAGAVLPACRRRGAERASLIRRMADAREGGAQVATLQTEAGSPVVHLCCHHLGFMQAYERTLWLPSSPESRIFRV
jgi:hypothetical protein